MKSFLRLLALSLPIVSLASIKGYNFGSSLETPLRDFTCSWQHPASFYINQLADLGFNSIRLPFSKQYVDEHDFTKMDSFIQVASQRNMTILMDFHRVISEYQSANPFTDLSLTGFTDTWISLLNRYVDNKNVYAVGIFNEFQQGEEKGEYWSEMMRQTIEKIEITQPPDRWVYFVGGVSWGGSLHNINLENQVYSDRVRYEVHKYHFSGTGTQDDWDYSFGNFTDKVVVGEWSISRTDWDDRFIAYLIKRNIRDNYYWSISNSHDTINLWENDCETINWDVINSVKRLWEE